MGTSGKFVMKKERWSRISEECQDFTKSLLEVDPKIRLTAKQALQHPWILNHSQHADVDAHRLPSMLAAFQTYKATPKFRRCCFLAMAWHLPTKEALRLQEEFFAIDKDQRGTISLAELKDLMVQQLQVPEDDVLDVFDAMDAHHD